MMGLEHPVGQKTGQTAFADAIFHILGLSIRQDLPNTYLEGLAKAERRALRTERDIAVMSLGGANGSKY